jgi:ABC-2 type transport system ATP-binding protein
MDIFEIVEKFLFFNAGYYGIPRKMRQKRIDEVLKLTGLEDKRKSKILALSGGMKRKLMIARALLHKPKILILDEPTAGVDVETRKHMWAFLQNLNKESKITFLLTTHYIEEAQQLCERIAIIQQGKIVACDTKEKIMKSFGKEEVVVTLTKTVEKKIVQDILKNYDFEHLKNQINITIPAENFDYNKLMIALTKLPLDKIITKEKSLEDIFVDLTNKYKTGEKV